MGKYTIKKNNLGKGVFSGEFNPINYIFYLAFLFLIKTFYYGFFHGFLGLQYFGMLAFWEFLFSYFYYGWGDGMVLLFLFSLQILALLPIVYQIFYGNGDRKFFIFLALNLVLNFLTFRFFPYHSETLITNIIWSSTLIPLFISFNPKEFQNTDIKMPSKIKLSGNLYDDLD